MKNYTEKFLAKMSKAQADYSTKFDHLQSGIKRAYEQFKATTHTTLHEEVTRRFKLGHWCLCWSQCMHEGEVTDALDLSKDKIVTLMAAPDNKQFPKIKSFSSWSWSFIWYLLKDHDILIGWNSDGTAMMLVFSPEQLELVETFLSEKKYSLYKDCL